MWCSALISTMRYGYMNRQNVWMYSCIVGVLVWYKEFTRVKSFILLIKASLVALNRRSILRLIFTLSRCNVVANKTSFKLLRITVFVFSSENRVTYARFKHNVYVVTSKMADHGAVCQD